MDPYNLSGRTLGQYQVSQRIGVGGMAQVYLAVQPALNRNVAVKVLAPNLASDPDFVTRFRREATLVAGLLHPNILPVHDFGNDGGLLYLVMAYVPGGTLHDRMQSPLEWATIVRITGQIADALDYAHEHGIVHRDLKPANIFMARPDYPLVGDFGIARLIQDGGLTVAGSTIGTPEYMSPEQAMGSAVDGRSDVYALGIILFQLLTGRVPFEGDSGFAIAHQHVYTPPPLPSSLRPGIPAALEAVTMKALAKPLKDRYQTAGEMKAALEAALVQLSLSRAEVIGPQGPAIASAVAPSGPVVTSVLPSPPSPPAFGSVGPATPTPDVSGDGSGGFDWRLIVYAVAVVLMLLVGVVAGVTLLSRTDQPAVSAGATSPSGTAVPSAAPATPSGTPGGAPTNLPTAIPLGAVLLEDAMRVDQGRWPIGRITDGEAAFVNGAYQVQTLATNKNPTMFQLKTGEFASFSYEAELRKVAGNNESGYGLAYRVHGTDKWYDLLITGDQQYCLGLWVGSLQGYDQLIPCTASTAINAGNASNRVKVVARGPEMVIYINNTFVAQITETRGDVATTGHLGVSAGPGLTVAVSNVRVNGVS